MKSIIDYTNELHGYFAKDSTIAPVEADATSASQGYSVGDQLVLDSVLYNVTADITAGDPLATTGAGANIAVADDITTQLGSVKQALSDEVAIRAKNGSYNHFDSNAFASTTDNGIIYTKNNNGSLTFSGTIGSGKDYSVIVSAHFILKAGTYVFGTNAVPTSGANRSTFNLYAVNPQTTLASLGTTAKATFTIAEDREVYAQFALATTGQSYSGTLYPSIVDANDAYDGFLPYAMTNQQLTAAIEKAKVKTKALTSVTTDATGAFSDSSLTTSNSVPLTVYCDVTKGVIIPVGQYGGLWVFQVFDYATHQIKASQTITADINLTYLEV